jgi:hypothetical protein
MVKMTMPYKYRSALVAALVMLLLAALACNRSQPIATPDIDLMVAQTQTAIAVAELLAPTSPAPTTAPPTPAPSSVASPVMPPPATQQPNCTDLARFVSETVPDNTEFAPAAQFMKTWVFQNAGTCTWTPDYQLVFDKGEQMGGTSPVPVGQTVAPNASLQVYLPQTAPSEPGEHQGFWMLQNLQGEKFGLGDDGQTAFGIKIKVVTGAPTTSGVNLGPPTRVYTFDSKAETPFYLGDGTDIGYKVDNGELIMTAFEPTGDQWRVAEAGQFGNLALEANFRTGSKCTGRDGYGMIVRAPSQPDNIINSAYVFGFNCDGQYRVYRMDNGHYTAIQNWTNHPGLQPGPNQRNIMTVVANGDKLQLYANSTLVYEFIDPTYPRGLFGLMIGSGGTEDFQVAVEQLSLWELP